jgi:hypothetical protein
MPGIYHVYVDLNDIHGYPWYILGYTMYIHQSGYKWYIHGNIHGNCARGQGCLQKAQPDCHQRSPPVAGGGGDGSSGGGVPANVPPRMCLQDLTRPGN